MHHAVSYKLSIEEEYVECLEWILVPRLIS